MQYVLCSNKEGMIDGKRRIPLGVGTKVNVYKSCYELSLFVQCLNCTFGLQQNSKLNVCKTNQKCEKKYDRFIKSGLPIRAKISQIPDCVLFKSAHHRTLIETR